MIEFALSTPFIMLILVAIVFFGRYFLLAQILLHAAQEGAKVASRTPNLLNEDVRDQVRGFSTAGMSINPGSVIYSTIGSARLLSQGTTGDMPTGSAVLILPFDNGSSVNAPPGTVQVVVSYPFQLLGNPFSGSGQQVGIWMGSTPFRFLNFTITESAVAAQEVYQQTN
ncbi:MAG TPA: TadE family protein [Planktothrix sp.]|jgi:Flp pilus assembly protein TadG